MKFLQHLLLLAGSLGVALLLGEGVLRVAGVAYNGSFFQADLQRGWALRPNTEGWEIGETKNYVRINSDGLHDREHALAKPPGTLRIAVLGDSCAESVSQPVEKAFPYLVEQQLGQCPSRRVRQVEVINFGVSGYGTAQELLTLRNQVWKYSPDIVLLAFYPGNDVFNNRRELNPSVGAEQCPYFVLRNGQLALDDSFQHAPDLRPSAIRWQALRARIVNHSRVVQLFYHVVNTYRQRAAEKSVNAKETAQLPSLDDQIYSPPTDPKLQQAWLVTEELLRMMNREVRAHGAEFWIVSLWTSRQVSPDPAARQQFCQRLGLVNLSYPDLRLRALAAKEQIPLTLLAPPAAAYAQQQNVYLNGGVLVPPGAGHFNEVGHRLAGGLIAKDLCSRSSLIAGSASAGKEAPPIACPGEAITAR
jgi:hypothetical protein